MVTTCPTGIEALPTCHLEEFISEWAMRSVTYPRLMGQAFLLAIPGTLSAPGTDKDPCVVI